MGFFDALKAKTPPRAIPANPANPPKGQSPATVEIRAIRGIRRGDVLGTQRARLGRLAAVADCPAFYVERLHPNEIAEYAHYPDAEVLASLRHLAACRECRARQCRPVTCATCASFLPNQLNPEAGMGQCADGFAKVGPLPWPHVQRHCHAWRKAAAEPAPCGEGG